jgi:hypothetical protein
VTRILALILALTIPASAQQIGCTNAPQSYVAASGCSGGSPPVICSNALDFSASCNSQYIPAVF